MQGLERKRSWQAENLNDIKTIQDNQAVVQYSGC